MSYMGSKWLVEWPEARCIFGPKGLRSSRGTLYVQRRRAKGCAKMKMDHMASRSLLTQSLYRHMIDTHI